ncbi:MAG: thioredoxin family protein [bacterium]|nr:thioredoxin family protein [bacterium]
MNLHAFSRLLLLAVLLAAAPATAEEGAHAVELVAGEAGSRLAPRYSPKGYKLPLAPFEKGLEEGHDHRQGRLLLGPQGTQGDGTLLVLARSVEDKAFDLLWLDSNGDGSVADEKVQRVKPRVSRGNTYTSYSAKVRVNHGTVDAPQYEPYPIGLWVAVEDEREPPAYIRYSRRGFLVGTLTLDEKAYDVVLSDANNDAVFAEGDWWTLLDTTKGQANDIAASRKVGDFAWAGAKAYKLVLVGTGGREGRVVPFDPGLTPEEDARKRDRLWDDKHAARAETPLAFAHEVDEAIQRARSGKAYYFLDFETVWCGPCKVMDRWVYTAKDVVAAAREVVCIKVDGDERKDLKEQHKVTGFPTGILFDSEGKEVARFSGYQSVKDMTAFFGRARKASEGGD